jgi:hypothetical protein
MKNFRTARIKALAGRNLPAMGDARSMFYGDAVTVESEDAADAIRNPTEASDVAVNAIVAKAPDESTAVERVAQYQAMTPAEKASVTQLPALACWNAMVIANPMLGKVKAENLNYMVTRCLNDFPYAGGNFKLSVDPSHPDQQTITLDWSTLGGSQATDNVGYVAVPFFRLTVAASTLNAAPGAQLRIDISAMNPEGATVNTKTLNTTFALQRISNTDAIVAVYIPTTLVATRTLPFLAVFGSNGVTAKALQITISGTVSTDQIYVTIPGYSTPEMREICTMYNLPNGQIR